MIYSLQYRFEFWPRLSWDTVYAYQHTTRTQNLGVQLRAISQQVHKYISIQS